MNRQILDEASVWFVEFRVGEVDPVASARFDEWLRRSPEHIRAYMEIAKTYVGLAALSSKQEIDVQKLIACARAGENVVPIGQQPRREAVARKTEQLRSARVRVRTRILAAACVVGLVIAATSLLSARRSQVYETGFGERRSITLADGSIIDLNAHSKVSVRFTASQRSIELSEGQALFEVAKDRARPFVVHSGWAIVRAVGTQFSVYRKKSGTTVTVVEGRVAVENDAGSRSGSSGSAASGNSAQADPSDLSNATLASAARKLVSAGEQVVVTEDTVAEPVRADIASATAWLQHRLIFDGSRLSDVAEDFNRYNSRQLKIEDPTLEDFHISGTYSSTDPASLLRFLRDQPGIRVIEADDVVRITRK